METYIIAAMLELLREKSYASIQMKEIAERAHVGRRSLYRYYCCKDDIMKSVAVSLMDDFAARINESGARGLEATMTTYFVFWEAHIDTLKLLERARLTYVIEDNLAELIFGVALKTKYKDMQIDLKQMLAMKPDKDKYEAYYMWAGIWKLTMLWVHEDPRRSPESMAQMACQIIEGQE